MTSLITTHIFRFDLAQTNVLKIHGSRPINAPTLGQLTQHNFSIIKIVHAYQSVKHFTTSAITFSKIVTDLITLDHALEANTIRKLIAATLHINIY